MKVWDAPSSGVSTGEQFVTDHKCEFWNKRSG